MSSPSSTEVPAAAHLVRPLTGIRAGDRAAVGGKAASLGELLAAGITVPAGFAVTTAAFGRVLAAADPDGAIPDLIGRLPAGDADAIAAVTAQVRSRILATPLPGAVREAILSSYHRLAEPGTAGGQPVAVRSSATQEDSEEASFAGLGDTYLWVRGEQAVLGSVRRCWASLYTAESVTYRRHQHLPEPDLGMGVVVQTMIDPRCAGVMFTRSPVTGDTSVVVVEANWGLGSSLVNGDVTPDRFVVSKVTGEIVARTVPAKLRQHRRGPAGTGVDIQDVPPHLRDTPCLRDPEIRAVAALGCRVSDHYGSPQDIEWALTGPDGTTGELVLLQSRPVTGSHGRGPAAIPKARAFDHVLERLSLPSNLGGAAP